MEYVDLGLPSGNLWASKNEEGYYDWVTAHWQFKDLLPRPLDFMELFTYCKIYQKGHNPGVVCIEGPNRNCIELPFAGWGDNSSSLKAFYWADACFANPGKGENAWSFSASPVYSNIVCFTYDLNHKFDRTNKFSIRLCKRNA